MCVIEFNVPFIPIFDSYRKKKENCLIYEYKISHTKITIGVTDTIAS